MVAALLFAACGNQGKNGTKEADRTEAQATAPRATGIYKGTLPAADGPGVATTVTLRDDNSCTIRSEYLGEKASKETFDETGSYRIEGDLVTVTLKGNPATTYYYRLEGEQLRMLDGEKQPVTGSLADRYLLKRTESGER